MGTSHLILGTTKDYLTGDTVPDTHDERILQKIARFLVEERHFSKNDISTRQKLELSVDGKTGSVTVHFVIRLGEKPFAIVMYGPGSIVTRQRPTLAAARLTAPQHIVPLAVITNGTDTLIMDAVSGKIIGKDLDGIPSKEEAEKTATTYPPVILSAERRKKEERILFAMDVLTRKECSDFVCGLNNF